MEVSAASRDPTTGPPVRGEMSSVRKYLYDGRAGAGSPRKRTMGPARGQDGGETSAFFDPPPARRTLDPLGLHSSRTGSRISRRGCLERKRHRGVDRRTRGDPPLMNRSPRGDRLVHRSPTALRPHPAYLELCGPVAAVRVRRVSEQAGVMREALFIMTNGTILDGHVRWQAAMERQVPSLPCIEYDLSEGRGFQVCDRTSPQLRRPERLLSDQAGLALGVVLQGRHSSAGTSGWHQ